MEHVCLIDLPEIPEPTRLSRLEPPTHPVEVVIDTDPSNEIDDQFAMVHALLSPDQLDVRALYAAPYVNQRAETPAEGMENSLQEIRTVLERMGTPARDRVFRGSDAFLADYCEPVPSEAADDLIRRAGEEREGPLYVVGLAAGTNIASAILQAPEIIERIVVVWLVGHGLHWPDTDEFNLRQDLMAARLIFDCGVPLVRIPCYGLASHLTVSRPEIERYVRGRGTIGDYLADIFEAYHEDQFGWTKVIWDMAAVACLLDSFWVRTHLVHSPMITDNLTWSADPGRHLIRSAWRIDRNGIFRDLFEKLETAKG